jgi:probable F420-dependent oxidoreductase
MKIAVDIFPTDQTINPVQFASAAEELGFESVWFPEHSHIPTSRLSPWGGRDGAPPLPDYYARTYDPFVALGACAAATSRIKLATGICLVAQRDPIHTAKEVASVDALSDGRMIFGIGYGWNKEEMAQHGTTYAERRALVRERILAMKALWTQEEASFAGDLVRIEPSWAWPKPTQQPHPPIVLGGAAGPRTAADIAEFCDGWMPIGSGQLKTGREAVQRACEDIGRDPRSVELGVFNAPPAEAKLSALAQLGVTRAVLTMPQGPRDEVLAELERLAPLIETMRDA